MGAGVAKLLIASAPAIAVRGGTTYSLDGIAVRSRAKARPAWIPSALLGEDVEALVTSPDIDVVIECIGGTTVAADAIETALRSGKHVVTANKDVLATRGPQLRALAAQHRVTIAYEAAVGGAIPIVRTIAESLAGEDILEVGGVLNGTTNFILSEMFAGATYERALERAQALGFAEADPTNDVEGVDAAHKLAILVQLGFRRALVATSVPRTGITGVTSEDVSLGKRLGLRIKLIACARAEGSIVTPAFVAAEHAFAKPSGAQNCIRVIGRSSGSLTFSGTGAGSAPTASAVIGDVVSVLRSIEAGRHGARVPDQTLTPVAGIERAPALGHVVRVRTLGDVRPAREALAEANVPATIFDGVPALCSAATNDGDAVRTILSERRIAVAGILPLWEDAPAPSEE
ncbi:MAG: homoserine dehydrogenase [Candidatus Eremiobacteraeota bacterium]|nr:homoserine dehydrogenase [Candidatus Eremiobacteraeota bacterium]